MANKRFIDFPIATTVGDNDIILIWQGGANKQTTKATILSGVPDSLNDLTDVTISGLTNGQILRYDSVTGQWENTDQGNLDLNDLNDVTIVSPTNGQVLVYNSSTSKWENSSGGYVPYVGAVTTVNLGAQTIQAGSFVKQGGTASQFLKADGSVDSTAYGTGSVTSVGLTMPPAFNVANSPVTTAGTLAVTGAGTVGQYIRGDGSLADFPQTSGGGSSVSYYLNGSVNQGTIGGIAYKELSKVPILGAGTDFTINADGYIASFITDAGDPSLLEIPGGNWNFETYFSASSSGGTPTFYVELYKVSGTTATLIASSSSAPEFIAFGTNLTPYFSTLAVPTTTLALTDRLAVRYYVTHSGRTITLHTENNHLCQIITTFTTGLTALNGLTAQVQNFAVGTTGTDFNIASATATHTFNLPTASATNRGALSSADWSLFTQAYNDKINSAAVTGTTTKTLTLTQQDGGTITASWSDLNTDAVLSVFGRTGNVVAANGDYTTAQVTESGNLYYTDARSRAALSFAAGSGAYNTSTGVITIPTNNNQIANGAGYITSAALAGYLPLSGGTLTGPLGGTTISLSGDITANRYRGVNSLVLNSYTTVNPSSNVYLYSPPSDRDAWIYLDSADTGSNWGIYHRQIDTAVSGLPANSIGFVGGGSSILQAWISLANGNGYYAGSLTAANLSGTNTGNVTIGTANGLSLSGQVLSLGLASGSANGALSSTDWTTFNNKQNAGNYVTTDTTQTITGQKTISRAATSFNGTVQSFLIDGSSSSGALTINSASTFYSYQNFAQDGVTKFEIGIVGTSNNGSFYINRNIQTGETGASIYIKKADGFVGINNINPSFQLDVTGTARVSGAATFSSSVQAVGTMFLQRASGGASTTIQFKNEIGNNRAKILFGGSVEELGFYAGDGSVPNLTITQNGNVLIGTQTDNGNLLRVNGNAWFDGGINPTKTAKNTYAIHIRGSLYGAPRLQLYDLAADPNAFVGLGVDMSGAPYEFSNYFPRTAGLGRWSVGSWAGDFGAGQYVSGYNEKLFITESAAQFNVPLTVNSNVASTFTGAYGANVGLNLSGTTYGVYGANRGASSASAGMNYFSVGSQRWFSGIYENSDNFGFYSVGTNGFPLILNYSTGAATFSSSVTAAQLITRSFAAEGGYLQFSFTAANSSSRTWRIVNDIAVYGDFSIAQATTQGGSTFNYSRLYINPSGNVGIGTTTDVGAKLHVSGNTYISGDLRFGADFAGLNTAIIKWQGSGANIPNSLGIFTWADSRDIQIGGRDVYFGAEGLVPRMLLKSSGIFLIGTTTDNGRLLRVNGRSYFDSNMMIAPQGEGWGEGLSFTMPNTNTWGGLRWRRERGNNDGNFYVGYTALDSTDDLVFGANNGGSQVDNILRLVKSGHVRIGTATLIGPAQGKLDVQYNGLVEYGMNLRTTWSGGGLAISFNNSSGSQIGTINTTFSATSYNTSSDYRLKEDLKDFNGIDLINKIKTYDFKWKSENSRSYGVIAHELKEVIDYAVFGEKDSVTMQGVDYSKLVPILIKAIQEQQVQIDKLKN